MNNQQLKKQLEEQFIAKGWGYSWDHKKETFSVEATSHQQPFEISLPKLQQKVQEGQESVEKVIQQLLGQMESVFDSMERRKDLTLEGKEREVFPVMRSTSFPTESRTGKKLVYDEHTAESRVFYAVDMGNTYLLIDEDLLHTSSWTRQQLKERALFNLRGLANEAKQDIVAGNIFYFFSTTDGYGASRILNQALLDEYASKAEGEICFAIPHQDVFVIADIRNETGYDVLGQLTFHFYASGTMPITALPFDYKSGEVEPIFILAKRKPK
ncbi:DUF1444 family protein [Caldalkalibacillus mannanilyticus]|uniref:DUF1444 family protein n=1 Tax=Caldalkalibacillus mannanilyticus TaxID=1418 RepID=UPI0004692AA5|nr:DUF1444 family protein [Caldalkalibacillus mannanilyticus]